MGYDAHTAIADPMCVDATRDDGRLTPDSPAVKLGFVNGPSDFHRVFLFSGMRGGRCVAAARIVPHGS